MRGFGDEWMRLRSVRSRNAGVMTTLMRSGRDRRLGKPVERARAFGWDPTSGSHQGQQPMRLHSKAEYMAAPERLADCQIHLALRAPSIHGKSRPISHRDLTSAFGVKRKWVAQQSPLPRSKMTRRHVPYKITAARNDPDSFAPGIRSRIV